ncbi:Choline dehydrogenase protein [Lasiodiplodia theobromae]|uniref:Choline dehydrogenase protein n=1 Tax=Lasiodiplodia theobromae TaxID=45133 RepID=UPI0015C39B90|nr:Choline dehydrogenase protein [Lasiodiplodia theobromae]KAF4535763.1 Choline dehydrogenase protein [Lasiodiplodia theobromae]
MMHLTLSAAAVAGFLSPALAYPSEIRPRIVKNSSGLLPCYNYVVIGGGASGLTVANRLSENPETSVLVIEAGDFDQAEDFIEIPGLSGGAVGTKYDWNISYVATADVNDRAVSIPQGKAVGGSTLLNRMLMHRGSAHDYDRWEALGNAGWSWTGLLPFFKKSEIFSPPNADVAAQYDITYDESAHGTEGRIHASYSPWIWPSTENYVAGAKELGINIPVDGQNGEALGAYWMTHAQDPTTVTRSSARKGYWDTAADRTNFHILPNTHVTKLLLNGTTVNGVEFAASAGAARQTVSISKEAIMAAGALHTPQILQLSGIGPASLLNQLGITPVVDLPVGYNLHDHVMVPIVHNVDLALQSANLQSNTTFAAEARAQYDSEKTGPYSTATGDILFFLPTENYTTAVSSLHDQALAQSPSDYLDSDTPSSFLTGYASQHEQLAETLVASDAATIEAIPSDGTIIVALMHPFSRGTVKIQSTDPFEAPLADSAFLKNPLDVAVLVEAVKFARNLFNTTAFAPLNPVELVPGSNITTDAAIETAVRNSATTVFHPVGSCHMGKQEEGACVDAQLKVYGIEKLRVVDGSVMPLVPAAHTMGTVYGVAEKAADIILNGSA